MKTKNQHIEKHSNVAQNFGCLASEFEQKISRLKALIRQRRENPRPTASELDDMKLWQKYATEYRDEQNRHQIAQKVCGNEFVLVRQTSY